MNAFDTDGFAVSQDGPLELWKRCRDGVADEAISERIERFTTATPEGCWLWTGYCDGAGYGRMQVRGHNALAHRVAYELYVGDIPDGLTLDHLCRRRSCVNPRHLEPVSHRENVMRGASFAAVNAAKTHCPMGHALAGANLYVNASSGARVCRECMAAARQRYAVKKRAA